MDSYVSLWGDQLEMGATIREEITGGDMQRTKMGWIITNHIVEESRNK